MNESVLYTVAEVAITLAGFSGVVVVFRPQGAQGWSPMELRYLWFLIGDSLLVLFLALLPIPLGLARWSPDATWGLCSAAMGSWLIVGYLLALRGERRDRGVDTLVPAGLVTPLLYLIGAVTIGMGVALLLSAFDLVVPRGQAVYVLGLILLLALAALEYLFFIARASRSGQTQPGQAG
jgi:hypothetical protein